MHRTQFVFCIFFFKYFIVIFASVGAKCNHGGYIEIINTLKISRNFIKTAEIKCRSDDVIMFDSQRLLKIKTYKSIGKKSYSKLNYTSKHDRSLGVETIVL